MIALIAATEAISIFGTLSSLHKTISFTWHKIRLAETFRSVKALFPKLRLKLFRSFCYDSFFNVEVTLTQTLLNDYTDCRNRLEK